MATKFDLPTNKFDVELETPFEATPFGIALNTVFGLPTAAKDVARTIQLGIARNIGSAGLSLTKPLGGVEELEKGEGIKRKAFEVLFGDEPLRPLEDRIASAEIGVKSSPTAQKLGIDKYALSLAFGAIIGDAALDLTPLIGTKTGIKALIRETTSEGVMKILTKSGIPADIAKEYAPKLAKSTSKKEVVEIVKLLQSSAGSKLVDDAVSSANDPISKLIKAVKDSGKPREVLEQTFTAERARRAGTVEGVFGGAKGQKGYYQALGKLKGELSEKKTFELIKLDQGDIDDLFNIAQQHPHLDVFDKVTVQNSLNKLLQGQLPSKRELIFLEEVYGRELIEEVIKKRGFLSKLGDAVTEVFNIPRTIITAFDMSAILRQGIIFPARQPKAFGKAAYQSFRQIFSPTNFRNWLDDLPNHPNYDQIRASKLYIADPDSLARGLSRREEAFMSRIAERFPKTDIPILKYPVNFFGTIYNTTVGAGVRASERAFVSFLNKLRVDVFTKLATNFGTEKKLSVDELKSIANFVNTGTGRGNLGAFERSAQALNTVFFSPRLIAARFNMLNPVWYARQTPKVRREAIKTMATFVGTGTLILGLVKLMGGDKVDVEIDPRSTDFGKIKVGNTRWDIWGGFQQWVRTFAQIATRERKTTEGEIVELTGKGFVDSPLDVATRFARYKLAPVTSLAVELVDGRTVFGEDITLSNEAYENSVPLYVQDLIDAVDEEGVEALFTVGAPAFFGVGVNTYKPRGKNTGSGINRFSF